MKQAWQRQFEVWLEDNQHRFPRPLIIKEGKSDRLDLSFQGLFPWIDFCLWENHLTGGASWIDGETVFWPLDLVMVPKREGRGYVCSWCDADGYFDRDRNRIRDRSKKFKSLEEMRIDHLFEPFAEWCARDLFSARYLQMWGRMEEGKLSVTDGRLLPFESSFSWKEGWWNEPMGQLVAESFSESDVQPEIAAAASEKECPDDLCFYAPVWMNVPVAPNPL
jgi:hypothetical protein